MEHKLIDVKQVAELLGCSQRGIWRLRDSRKMPAAVTIGRLVRWRLAEITAWIADGCPDVRRTGWKLQRATGYVGGCACKGERA